MISLGAFYLIEQGPFLGLVQIIVYTGAIMILFLFVLMLVGRDSSDSLVETLRGQRWAAALFGIGFALLVALGGRTGVHRHQSRSTWTSPNAARRQRQRRSPQLLFTKYLFAFELTSALLIVAAVGAMVLAHIERDEPEADARRRWRASGSGPAGRSRCPGPGVLSSRQLDRHAGAAAGRLDRARVGDGRRALRSRRRREHVAAAVRDAATRSRTTRESEPT